MLPAPTLDYIAGGVGGCAGVIVGHPLDTVKVRLVLNPKYRGTFHCFRSTLQNEGMRGLFRGITSPLYSMGIVTAMVFGVKSNVLEHMDSSRISSHFLAGSAAGLCQSWISSPMELAKIRMQAQYNGGGKKNRFTDYLKKVYDAEGIRGVCKGMNLTIARQVPAFGVYFSTYEYLCRLFTPPDAKCCSMYGFMVAGGIAGSCSCIPTYPVDVVKTRIQKDSVLKDGRFQYRYNGYMDCIRQSIAEDGYRVFIRGLHATIARSCISNAIIFPVYTISSEYLRQNQY